MKSMIDSGVTNVLGLSTLLKAYRTMRTIRDFEERLHIEFATGEVPGFVHLYAGEEAIATGVCMNLREGDRIASTHRGHGHCIAKGVDLKGMAAEIYGKKSGTCGGKGGSMHIADLDKGMMGANGIVGGGPPLVCGAGLAAKRLGAGNVAVAFVGDGGANQGTTLESLNLAAIWKLPCIFVIENNGYAEATSCRYSVSVTDIASRAAAFNMPGLKVDGHNFLAVYEAARESIRRARDGEGPTLIECKVARYFGHYEGDTQAYRGPDEVKKVKEECDCIVMLTAEIIRAYPSAAAELERIDTQVLASVEEAITYAQSAAKPSLSDLLSDVYVSY
jgi:acetoin:2,6-dichlorophenolindophenol oxidoreductase subunit alpha